MGRIANSYAAHLQRHHRRLPIVTTMRTGKKLPWAYRLGLRRTCHTVANSREAARSLTQDYAVPAEKISLIYNATVFPPEPRTDGTDAAAAALRTLHGATPQTPVMLCVAMFRPEKNQRELIALLARLPRDREWQLWLAGDGTARRACEKQIAALGLATRVKLLGFHHDPRPLYRAADIAVLTSRSESLPNFLIEAHAHRLPSLAYATGGVAECGGAVVPLGDQAAFLAALRPLLFDGTARAAAAETAAAHAAAHFSPAAQLAAYEKLFARLCHQ
jgi:glycosyltransferase involved in cell wall biosynthesis